MANINNLKRKAVKVKESKKDMAVCISYSTHADLTINGQCYFNISHAERDRLLAQYEWDTEIDVQG